MQTPTIITDRLILRPLYVTDAETFFERIGSDMEVARFMTWNLHRSIDDTIEWLKFEESKQDSEDVYTWAIVIKNTAEIVGAGGFLYREDVQLFEIGYEIVKPEWNKGYVTEFAEAIIEFATEELGETKISGKHAIDNPASGRVLQKVGFLYQNEGVYRSLDGKRSYNCRNYLYSKE